MHNKAVMFLQDRTSDSFLSQRNRNLSATLRAVEMSLMELLLAFT
jgi:hypothetical protein